MNEADRIRKQKAAQIAQSGGNLRILGLEVSEVGIDALLLKEAGVAKAGLCDASLGATVQMSQPAGGLRDPPAFAFAGQEGCFEIHIFSWRGADGQYQILRIFPQELRQGFDRHQLRKHPQRITLQPDAITVDLPGGGHAKLLPWLFEHETFTRPHALIRHTAFDLPRSSQIGADRLAGIHVEHLENHAGNPATKLLNQHIGRCNLISCQQIFDYIFGCQFKQDSIGLHLRLSMRYRTGSPAISRCGSRRSAVCWQLPHLGLAGGERIKSAGFQRRVTFKYISNISLRRLDKHNSSVKRDPLIVDRVDVGSLSCYPLQT